MKTIHPLLKNTAILSVTSLILKTIGIFFRIFLSEKIGAEGMGLYQLIISVYALGSTFASSGLSTAATRLIADELVCGDARSVRRILRKTIGLSLLIAAVSTVLFYFGAPLIGNYWIQDARAIPAIRILSFAFPFMGLSSCIKGYFVARRRVASSSRAQLLEQISRIVIILLLLRRFAAFGLTASCAAVMVGDVLSEGIACGYVFLSYCIDKRRLRKEVCSDGTCLFTSGKTIRRILSIAVPITAGRYLHTLLRTAENILVPQRLSAYSGSQEEGLAAFGALKGMAMPLIFFPSSFLSAFSTLLIPEMSEARALGQHRRVQRTAAHTLHVTLVSSILVGGLFWLLAYPLAELLYHSEDVGRLLRVLAPLVPIMYVESVVDGILKGLNQQSSSLRYSVTDSALRILLIFLLVPLRGMQGFLCIMVFSNLFTCGMNVRRLCRVSKVHIRWKQWVFLPFIAAVGSVGVARLLWSWTGLSSLWGELLFGGTLTTVLYVPALFKLGCLSRDDLSVRR